VIVAVGSDKGSPGATTLATALGLVWPGERLVCDLDLRGADLPFRLLQPGGQHMRAAPSIATLAVDARPGAQPPHLPDYAQATTLGVPVIRGEVSTRTASKVAPHLPAIASLAAAWPGTVIADIGSLQPSNPALVVTKAAAVVLLVTHASTEALGRLRGRAEELAEYVGDPRREGTSVGVVVMAERRDEDHAVGRTKALLNSIGSPAPVIGPFRYDRKAVAALWAELPGKKLARSSMVRSVDRLVREIERLWPGAVSHPTSADASEAAPTRVGA
jgi:hypothetical protein